MGQILSTIRVIAWVFAMLANLAAMWLGYHALAGVTEAVTGPANPFVGAGAMAGAGIGMIYALAISIIPTCFALSVSGITREERA